MIKKGETEESQQTAHGGKRGPRSRHSSFRSFESPHGRPSEFQRSNAALPKRLQFRTDVSLFRGLSENFAMNPQGEDFRTIGRLLPKIGEALPAAQGLLQNTTSARRTPALRARIFTSPSISSKCHLSENSSVRRYSLHPKAAKTVLGRAHLHYGSLWSLAFDQSTAALIATPGS